MTTIDEVNYKYLGVAIIFLIITYYYLNETKHTIHKKEIDNSHKNAIKIATSKGEILMDPNIFEIHMTRLKDNIITLNKNFTPKDCPKLKKHLDKAKVNTRAYINMNTNNINSSFCDINYENGILYDSILQERELLKNKLSNKTEKDDNDETIDSDNMRYTLLELVIDIDIILFLIRSSLCKKGSLDLSCLDSAILELYRNNCLNEIPEFSPQSKYTKESFQGCETELCGINNPSPYYAVSNRDKVSYEINSKEFNSPYKAKLFPDEINSIFEETDYYKPHVNTLLGLQPKHISRCVPSQDIDDTNTMPVKKSFEQKRINYNATDSSQSKAKEFECNKFKLGKQLNYSDYYHNGLEWFTKQNNSNLDSRQHVDTSSRSCLLESL